MAQNLKVVFALCVISFLFISVIRCEADLESENQNENKDDLETAEFLFWPKLFFYKAAAAKTVAVKTVPVEYSYKPVTYTAYKWVPVPYQVTVQQPVIQKTVSVVKAPAVTVVKTASITSSSGDADSSSTSSSSD